MNIRDLRLISFKQFSFVCYELVLMEKDNPLCLALWNKSRKCQKSKCKNWKKLTKYTHDSE